MIAPPSAAGSYVLDSQGLYLAAMNSDRQRAIASGAADLERLVLVSSITLAEVLHGSRTDARVHRYLKGVKRIPVDDSIAKKAGALLGSAPDRGKTKSRTVDAIVCATAILHAPRPVVIVSSDPDDLRALLGHEPGIAVNRV